MLLFLYILQGEFIDKSYFTAVLPSTTTIF